jgi:hypothetical protein
MKLTIDKTYYWLHGEYHRQGKVRAIKGDNVLIEGLLKTYWIGKKTLINKISKSYPECRSGFL